MVDIRSPPELGSTAEPRLAFFRWSVTAGSPVRIARRSLLECPASEIRSGFCGAVRVSLRPGASAWFELAGALPSHFYHRIARPAPAARQPAPATRTHRRAVQRPQPQARPSACPEQLREPTQYPRTIATSRGSS